MFESQLILFCLLGPSCLLCLSVNFYISPVSPASSLLCNYWPYMVHICTLYIVRIYCVICVYIMYIVFILCILCCLLWIVFILCILCLYSENCVYIVYVVLILCILCNSGNCVDIVYMKRSRMFQKVESDLPAMCILWLNCLYYVYCGATKNPLF